MWMLHDRKTESLANFSLHFHTACGIIRVAVHYALAEQSANEQKGKDGICNAQKTDCAAAGLPAAGLPGPAGVRCGRPGALRHGQCSGRHGHSHTQSSRRQRRAQRSLHAQLRQLADAQQDRKGSAACSGKHKGEGKGRLQLGRRRSRGRSGRADADVHERSDEELYLQGVRRQGDGQEL